MTDGSRWQRWGRWPYQALGWLLLLLPAGARLIPSSGTGSRAALAGLGLVSATAGAVLVGGAMWHRIRRTQDEEIRRNPTGKTVPLDDRLAAVDRPRSRWVLLVALLLGFCLGTTWAIYMAATTDESVFMGFAIFLFIPVPLLAWAAWRTRAMLRMRQ